MLGGLRSTFAALAVRDFRLLWIGALTAFLSFFMSDVVQAVVAFELTGQNRSVGVVAFGRGLAMMALGPIGGAVADRVAKRRILLAGQTMTAVVFLLLAALMASGAMSVPFLAVGGFATGMVFAFLGPTRQAYVPELVPDTMRGNAVALNQVALNASRVGGPALAGLGISLAWIGATGAFLMMAGLYLFAVWCQAKLPKVPPRPLADDDRGVFADVVEGVRYVRTEPRLRNLVLFFVLVVVLGFPYVILLPGLVQDHLQRDVGVVSLLYAVSAVGGLGASLLLAPLADSPRATALYVASAAGLGLSLLGLAQVESLPWAVLAVLLIGVTGGGVTTLNGAVLVREAEPRYLGRVMSLSMLAFAAFGVAGLPIGALADALGVTATMRSMGVAVCSMAVLFGVALLGAGRRAPALAGEAPKEDE